MTEVVLHIGAHKCATTAVQRGVEALAGGRPDLAYVGPIGRDGPDERSRPLADFVDYARRAKGHGLTGEGVADGLCRLVEAHRGARRIIVSDENILGGMPGVARRFYPRSEEVRRVLDIVAARFRTSVFLQSRETGAFLESCRRFRIMQGAPANRAGFFAGFESGSVSWAVLGATLFDGAAFAWRVLPIERLADPAQDARTAADLGFLVPGWSLGETPLESVNVSRGPLVRAALLALNLAGEAPARPLRNAIARRLATLEEPLARADREAAAAMIAAALGEAGLAVDADFARRVHELLVEERGPAEGAGADEAKRFADDYAAFIARYAS